MTIVTRPHSPARFFRYRARSRRPHPRVAAPRADSTAPDTNDLPSIQHIVEAATSAAIAAVDHHFAHLGLCPRPETASSHYTVPPSLSCEPSADSTAPPADGLGGPNH